MLGTASSSTKYTLSGKSAKDFYLDCMEHGGAIPTGLSSQQRSVADLAFKWFSCMASPQERLQLKLRPPQRNEATCAEIGVTLNKLVVARIAQGFKDKSLPVPPRLTAAGLLVNSVEAHSRPIGVIPDAAAFLRWRTPPPPKANARTTVFIEEPPPRTAKSPRLERAATSTCSDDDDDCFIVGEGEGGGLVCSSDDDVG